jgi:hypothetical protein
MVKLRDQWVRTLHLTLGVATTGVLLIYGLSALQFWYRPPAWTVEPEVALPVPADATPRELARVLRRDHGLAGELADIVEDGGAVEFALVWPGTRHQVTHQPGASAARITTSRSGPVGLLSALHHLDGLWHDSLLLNGWGVVVALASAGLIALGVTGVWMTFRRQDERVIGSLVLVAGLVVGLGLVIAIRLQ